MLILAIQCVEEIYSPLADGECAMNDSETSCDNHSMACELGGEQIRPVGLTITCQHKQKYRQAM